MALTKPGKRKILSVPFPELNVSLLAANVVLGGGGCEVVQGRMEAGQGVAGAAGHLPSNGKGGILYCVVARGATVLARCS